MSDYGFKHFDGCYSNEVFTFTFRKNLINNEDNYITVNVDKVISVDSWLELDLPNEEDNINIECKNEDDFYTAMEIFFAK